MLSLEMYPLCNLILHMIQVKVLKLKSHVRIQVIVHHRQSIVYKPQPMKCNLHSWI